MASNEWVELFLDARVSHLGVEVLDHIPILLNTHPSATRVRRPFRFLKAWSEDSSYFPVVQHAWSQKTKWGMESYKLGRRRHNTAKALSAWNKNHFGLTHVRIRYLEEELRSDRYESASEIAKLRDLEEELRMQRKRLELIYAQKSRELWLREGDRNTRFFHTSITMRKRRNYIGAILDGNTWLKTLIQIHEYFLDKFEELYSSGSLSIQNSFNEYEDLIISENENLKILRIPSNEEIHKCI